MSSDKKNLSLKLELLWWVFTGVVLIAVLFAILSSIEHYPFLYSNIFFVIVFITLARYLFLLRYTFLAERQKLKAVIVFASVPFIFYLVSQLNHFQTHLDEQGIEAFIGTGLSFETRNQLGSFIRNEMLFFGVGSVIVAILFPFRMMMSIWLLRNRGRV